MDAIMRSELEELVLLPFKTTEETPSVVPIKSAHISGISYLNIGDAGIELLSEFEDSGLRVSVPTTMNPGFVELGEEGERTCDVTTYEKQAEIIDLLKRIGVTPSLSCAPYFEDNPPNPGDHLAWAESSAVLYVNSVIGAWTNKESGIGALASAIVGFTANVGVHRAEGRIPKLRVRYEGSLENEVEAGALGYVVGRKGGTVIHYIEAPGLQEQDRTIEYLAAFGTSGSAPMVWIHGASPREFDFHGARVEEALFYKKEIEETIEELSSEDQAEAIIIGCPHVTLNTIKDVAQYNDRLALPTYLFTSARVKRAVESRAILKRDGKLKVVADSCVMWCGLRRMGFKTVVTNSVKAAFYLSHQMRINARLRSLKEILSGEEI